MPQNFGGNNVPQGERAPMWHEGGLREKVNQGRYLPQGYDWPMGSSKEKKAFQGKDGLGENMGFKEKMGLWVRCVPKDAQWLGRWS